MLKNYIAPTLASLALMSLLLSPVLAENSNSQDNPGHEGSDKPKTSLAVAPTIDTACVSTAVGTRDEAIISALDAYYNAAKTALQARESALKAAWALTDKAARRTAIKKAWSDYNSAVRAARKTFKTARNTAWSQFKTNVKACQGGASAAAQEGGGAGNDNQL